MNNQSRMSRIFRTSAAAMSFVVLLLGYGCGGGSSPGEAPVSVSVQMRETDTVLSVSTEQPARSGHTKFEAQAMNFSFAAQVESGPDAGTAIQGRLELKGEREDDGALQVEGRLFPDADPSLPSPAELKEKFAADRKALKFALREDIKVMGEELRAALAAGTPYKEALATFRAKFLERVAQYRAALSALIADYRAAIRNGRTGGEDDDARDAKGYAVRGTVGADGAVSLTIDLGDRGKVIANGTTASDGSWQGDFTGPASGDQGTWTATANDAGQPPSPPPPPPTAGTYEAGLAKYMAMCSGCHSAGKVDTTGTAGNLAGEGDDLVSDLGRVDPAMSGLLLSAQDILDLKAFLRAANSPPPAGSCAGQDVTWSLGASTCNAPYSGGASGTSADLSDIVGPTTGTAVASCSNGVLSISSPVCNTAAPPPPTTPAPCAAQDVMWSQGAASCNAAYAGGASGTSAALSDIVGPTTGTATASCSNGVLTVSTPVCVTSTQPPPTPAPCAAQDVTWSQGTSTCNAPYSGGASGTSAALSDILGPTTGTATASCNNGALSVSAPVCSTAAPTGTYEAGLAKYNAACASCHRAGSVDPTGPFSDLKGKQNNVVANLGSINSAMSTIVLTSQEVLDLKAFLSQVQ